MARSGEGRVAPAAAGVLHAERVEDRLAQLRLVGLPRDLLDHAAERGVAEVAVVEALARRGVARQLRGVLEAT